MKNLKLKEVTNSTLDTLHSHKKSVIETSSLSGNIQHSFSGEHSLENQIEREKIQCFFFEKPKNMLYAQVIHLKNIMFSIAELARRTGK